MFAVVGGGFIRSVRLSGSINRIPYLKSCEIIVDGLVKSRKTPFSVIPAKAGIQSFQIVADHLDSGFHRSDDFLRVHQT